MPEHDKTQQIPSVSLPTAPDGNSVTSPDGPETTGETARLDSSGASSSAQSSYVSLPSVPTDPQAAAQAEEAGDADDQTPIAAGYLTQVKLGQGTFGTVWKTVDDE